MLRSVSLEVVPCFVRIFAMTTEETTYQLKPAACGKKGTGGIFTRNENEAWDSINSKQTHGHIFFSKMRGIKFPNRRAPK